MTSTSSRLIRLLDCRTPERSFIPAFLYRDCLPDLLQQVEASWSASRRNVFDHSDSEFEHAHWDWRNKAGRIAVSDCSLVAVECESQIQGLMLVFRNGTTTVQPKRPLIYVDYLETAPWNLRTSVRSPRFSGVGTVLIADAIRLSMESTCDGRIGLHSLPQAEAFYSRIGMSFLGNDPGYRDLAYYEYDGSQARNWFESIGERV